MLPIRRGDMTSGLKYVFSALTLLVRCQQEDPARKNLSVVWWGAGMVIFCCEVQIACIWFSWCHCHPITSASAKSRMVYPSGTDSPRQSRTKGRKPVVVVVVTHLAMMAGFMADHGVDIISTYNHTPSNTSRTCGGSRRRRQMWSRWCGLTFVVSWWHGRCLLQGTYCWHGILQHRKYIHWNNIGSNQIQF